VLYICTICDSTNINTIIDFVPHVSGDGFNGGSDSYLQFRDTHAPCLLKLCIPSSNGILRWWLFREFGAELPLDNFTPTIILNNPVFFRAVMFKSYSSCSLCDFPTNVADTNTTSPLPSTFFSASTLGIVGSDTAWDMAILHGHNLAAFLTYDRPTASKGSYQVPKNKIC